jgi:hypothetical protein
MQKSVSDATYRIYLLTAWQEPRQVQTECAPWRFLLADPHTGRRYGFINPDGLIMALQQLNHASLDIPLDGAPLDSAPFDTEESM